MDSETVERRLVRWSETADEAEQRLVLSLSAALSAPLSVLVSAVVDAYNEAEVDQVLGSLLRLVNRPFIEEVAVGYRVTEPLAAALRARFLRQDPHRFALVTAHYASIEDGLVESLNESADRWFARGRRSFYTASLNPGQAATEFGHIFATAPSASTAPRAWLSQLVLRQRDRLDDEHRALSFFEAFEHYRHGRTQLAYALFDDVLSDAVSDTYRAVALHLRRPRTTRERISQLRESVRLSGELGLVENEVMARNSLLYALVGTTTRRSSTDSDRERSRRYQALTEARALAGRNLEVARTHGRDYLFAVCLAADALTLWLAATDNRRLIDGIADGTLARQVVEQLNEAAGVAIRVHDYDTTVVASDSAASVLADLGDANAVIVQIATWYERLSEMAAPAEAYRWARTLRRLASSQMTDPRVADEARRLARLVDSWRRAGGM